MAACYLLDTNHCIAYMRSRSAAHPAVSARMRAAAPGELFVSYFTAMELAEAPWLAPSPYQQQVHRQTLAAFFAAVPIVPLTTLDIETFGRVRAYLRGIGQLLESFDVAIAATALTHSLTLVTHDAHFQRLQKPFGLQIEDWFP